MIGCAGCGRPLPPKGVLTIDRENVTVMVNGRVVKLNNAEFLVLQRLAEGRGVVSRVALCEAASIESLESSAHNVPILRLRRKIGAQRIVTVPIRGYRLVGRFAFKDLG